MTEDLRSPILPGKGASDYERYLRTDELLALQKPADEMLHPDELTFQVTHQASELLMKGAAWELDRARICILQGDYKNAARLLRRANKMLVHPLRMLALLETITPYEYHVIRAGLGHGSGLDSPGFLALLHIAPRLGEAFFDQVKNAGLTLEQLYYRHAEFLELHEIAEELLDYDEQIQLFRYAHLKLAQRIIGGGVVGTMGTPVEVLQKRMEFPLYRALWDVRNEITSKVNAEHATGHGGAY